MMPRKGYKLVQLRPPRFVEYLIPEEWEVKRLDYFLETNMGQSPPSDSYNSDEEGTPFLQGVTEFG